MWSRQKTKIFMCTVTFRNITFISYYICICNPFSVLWCGLGTFCAWQENNKIINQSNWRMCVSPNFLHMFSKFNSIIFGLFGSVVISFLLLCVWTQLGCRSWVKHQFVTEPKLMCERERCSRSWFIHTVKSLRGLRNNRRSRPLQGRRFHRFNIFMVE